MADRVKARVYRRVKPEVARELNDRVMMDVRRLCSTAVFWRFIPVKDNKGNKGGGESGGETDNGGGDATTTTPTAA